MKRRLYVSVEDEVWRWLLHEAAQRGISAGTFARILIYQCAGVDKPPDGPVWKYLDGERKRGLRRARP